MTELSELHLVGRSVEDQVVQAALAVLASADPTIDGLWWTDTLDGEMRTERGGIYQHRLGKLRAAKAPPPPVDRVPQAVWLRSTILDG